MAPPKEEVDEDKASRKMSGGSEPTGMILATKLLLTPEKAAQVLSIGRTRLYDLIRTEQLESVNIGTSRRIPAAALHRFVARLSRLEPEPTADVTPHRQTRGRKRRPFTVVQSEALPFDD